MRDLTSEEEKAILEFWKTNPDKDSSDVVKIFGARFGVEIPEHTVIEIAIGNHMRERGVYSKELADFVATTIDEMR